MCSKLKYFVLALFLDAVASSPYIIPRYDGIYNREAAIYANNEQDVQRINQESYLPRSLPSYMSPIPTAIDLEMNEEIQTLSSNVRDLRSLNNNVNEKEYSRTKKQLPSVAQSASSNVNPSSTLNGNEVLSHLLRQNRPIVKNIAESSTPVKGSEIQSQINDKRFKLLPLNENFRTEAISQVGNINNEPLRIQSAPEQRIAFQPPVFHNVPNLDAYHPAIPVKFNIDREWSNIAKQQPKLPDFIAERLRHPVDFQRSQIYGQQVHKPLLNAELPSTEQKYNIQKIISNQRIQNVLSSTKQTKRYLVIHPNGTVEHVDNLAPIASRHPNYVLVNAGHIVSANNPKTNVNIDERNAQAPAPILEPISSSKVPVVRGIQLPEPLIKNKETVVNLQTSSSEISTIVEAVPFSESKSETAKTNENEEPEAPEKSFGDEAETVIETGTTIKIEAENSESNKESNENTTNIVESSFIPPVATPEQNSKTAETYKNQKTEASEKCLGDEDKGAIETNTTLKTGAEDSESIIESNENTANVVESSFIPPVASPEQKSKTDKINENQKTEASEKSLGDEGESIIETNTNLKTGTENSGSIEGSNENTAYVVEASPIKPVAISTESVRENDASEVISGPANKVENEDASPVDLENNSENERDISIVQSTQNTENSEGIKTDGINELDSVGARRTGKPMVYYTSDPDFWNKVTDGEDSNVIFFFQVKSNPRVETDRQRTVYPDGTILEELTETVWDGEGGEPKVTKSSKLIHPDDL